MNKPNSPRKPGATRFKRHSGFSEKPAPLSRIMELDRDLLRLLMKRFDLLKELRRNGRLEAKDEKALREAWQQEVGKVSRDPDLSGLFFTFLQQLSFLPRQDATANPGDQRFAGRAKFNLAPLQQPVAIQLDAPLSNWATLAWLYLAAASGQPVQLGPCLQNDPQVDFIKAIVQLGASVSREGSSIAARGAPPIDAPDRVLYVGDSEFAFYLLLAHYVGRHSRVKFTGSPALKMADFSSLGNFLPYLQARLVNLVPKMAGLPARLECAGVLPPGITLPPEAPALFAEALILCAPFYASPFSVDLRHLAAKESILAHVVPVLREAGILFSLNADAISLQPGALALPSRPALPLEPQLASFILSLPAVLTGEVILNGSWPDWPELKDILQTGFQLGWTREENRMRAHAVAPSSQLMVDDYADLPEWGMPFYTALAACVAMKRGKAVIPSRWADNPNIGDFLAAIGLTLNEAGDVIQKPDPGPASWNAPKPAWLLALALAACSRQGKQGFYLGNPAEIMELWPAFWNFYNGLPTPDLKSQKEEPTPGISTRRRIKTSVNAVLPETPYE